MAHGRYNIPPEIRRLPIPLLRSQRYPGDPEYVREHVQEYLDGGEKPIYMPQKMGFVRWKRPPYQRSFRSAVGSPIEALASVEAEERRIIPEHMHLRRREAVAAMGANRLPQHNPEYPGDEPIDPGINQLPVARGAVPLRDFVTGSDLNELISSVRRSTLAGSARRYLGRDVARETVRGLQALYDDEVND